MKKVAIMMDGGYVLKRYKIEKGKHATATDIVKLARACLSSDEELFRIYFYDCPPFEGYGIQPISGQRIDFSATETCKRQKSFQQALAVKDHLAFRRGALKFNGWKIKGTSIKELSQRRCDSTDIVPDLVQKRVDIKIGLDAAWLASKQIVDRILLLTGDSDFIPAMKFARREGVQVILVPLDLKPKSELLEHADEFRKVKF